MVKGRYFFFVLEIERSILHSHKKWSYFLLCPHFILPHFFDFWIFYWIKFYGNYICMHNTSWPIYEISFMNPSLACFSFLLFRALSVVNRDSSLPLGPLYGSLSHVRLLLILFCFLTSFFSFFPQLRFLQIVNFFGIEDRIVSEF